MSLRDGLRVACGYGLMLLSQQFDAFGSLMEL